MVGVSVVPCIIPLRRTPLQQKSPGCASGKRHDCVFGSWKLSSSFVASFVARRSQQALKLSNANAGHFTGGILVEEGTLRINHSDALNGMAWVNLGGGDAPVTLAADNISTINHCGIRLYADSTNTVTLSFGIANAIEFKNSLRFERQLVVNSANSSADIRLTALLYGYGGIYKTGPGSLRLASYNNQTGPIVISQGRVLLQQHNGAMSGGTVVLGDKTRVQTPSA
jgi:autotransporter-associated beta strand protein